jgi:CubicO group peptidase (beta-lactamase class C family)
MDHETRKLDGPLEQLSTMKGVRHAVMAVERKDGSFCWSGAKGIAQSDGTPMQTATPFWIASITKLYIASCIFKLQEAGMLSIHDRVMNYLPTDLFKGVHVIEGVDYSDRLTIRHLLSHSSGIPDYLEIKAKGEPTLIDQVLEGKDMSWSIADTLQIVRKVNAPLFPPQNLSSPKYRVRYSDTNYQILIAIIEAVTKKTVEDAFQEMLFQPLHLAQTFHPGANARARLGAAATVWIEETSFDHKPLAMQSFGDLYSTLDDLTAFMRALLDGKVFDSPETFALMAGNWQTFGFALSPIAPGWPIQYGLGMMRFKMPRFFTPFRPTPEVIGHTGAVGSWLFYCPPLDLILAGTVSQLTAAAAPFKIVPKILQIFRTA